MGLFNYFREKAQKFRFAVYKQEYDHALHSGLTETEAAARVIRVAWKLSLRTPYAFDKQLRQLVVLLGGKTEAMHFLDLCHRHGITKFVANSIVLDVFFESHGEFFLAAGPLVKRALARLEVLFQRLTDRPPTDDEVSDIVMLGYWATIICPKNPTGWYVLALLDKLESRKRGDNRDFITEGLAACNKMAQFGFEDSVEPSKDSLQTQFLNLRTKTIEELLAELKR